ncbi:TPA: hypothetical protein HA241_04220 [Candidatus Woesearchaeota archaeon]|nr:hypothetical protein [Candidatus Woesearchaeota archaeon]
MANDSSLEKIVVVEPQDGNLHPAARFARGVDTTIDNQLAELRDTPLYATLLKEAGVGLASTALNVLVGTLLGRVFYGYEEGYSTGAIQGAVMGVTKNIWNCLNTYSRVKKLRKREFSEIEREERERLFEARQRLMLYETWSRAPHVTIGGQSKEEYRLEAFIRESLPGLGYALPFIAAKGLTWKTALASLAIEGLTSFAKEIYYLFSAAGTEQQLQESIETQRTANNDGSINAEYAVTHGGAAPRQPSALVRYRPIPLTPVDLAQEIYEKGREVDPYHARNEDDREPINVGGYRGDGEIEPDDYEL